MSARLSPIQRPIAPQPRRKHKPRAERQADHPVGEEVAEHRRAGVADAAKSACGDGLNSVEELKGGAGREQADRSCE